MRQTGSITVAEKNGGVWGFASTMLVGPTLVLSALRENFERHSYFLDVPAVILLPRVYCQLHLSSRRKNKNRFTREKIATWSVC